MGMGCEMNDSNMVSNIEKLLPPTQKREWVILAEGLADTGKLFESLLEVLLREKREYMNSSVRLGSSNIKAQTQNMLTDITDTNDKDTNKIVSALQGIQNQQKQIVNLISNLTQRLTK